MSQTVLYITSNPMKRRTVERFIKQHVPDFKIASREVAFYEPQTLSESDVISYKALEAWKIFRRPLIVDDAGFYLDEYECFPGPCAKPVVISLGWPGMLQLAAPSYKARVYCRLGYVDNKGVLHHFRGETVGTLEKNVPTALVERRGVYALLRPEDCDKTIAEMIGTDMADIYSPRARALRAFVKNVLLTHEEQGTPVSPEQLAEQVTPEVVTEVLNIDQSNSNIGKIEPVENGPESIEKL